MGQTYPHWLEMLGCDFGGKEKRGNGARWDEDRGTSLFSRCRRPPSQTSVSRLPRLGSTLAPPASGRFFFFFRGFLAAF